MCAPPRKALLWREKMTNIKQYQGSPVKIKKTKKSKLYKRTDKQLLMLCLPALLKIFIFSYLPMIGIIIAFQFFKPDYGFMYSPFVGFKNFDYLIKSSAFIRIFSNAVILNMLFVIFTTIVALMLGLFLFEFTNKFFLKITQTVMIFPFFVAWPLVGAVLIALIGDTGAVTKFIEMMTGNTINFYNSPQYWRLILTVVQVWKVAGLQAIIYSALLMSADREIYEAASIDGAGMFKKMFMLSLPHLSVMIVLNIIMSMANIVKFDFGMIWFLTNQKSMLQPTTDVIETYMYRVVRTNGDYSIGAAVGLLQGVTGLVLSIITNWVCRRISKESAIF